MYDTDAAGILYFGSQFRFVHEAFESMIDEMGINFRTLVENESFMIVIAHAESDYLQPVRVGDILEITSKITRIGTTSFTISYTLSFQDRTVCGKAQTVHVSIDKKTRNKIPLPEKLKPFLEQYK